MIILKVRSYLVDQIAIIIAEDQKVEKNLLTRFFRSFEVGQAKTVFNELIIHTLFHEERIIDLFFVRHRQKKPLVSTN